MSHARKDDDTYGRVRRFFDDLSEAVAERVPDVEQREAGFLDTADLDRGDVWPDTLIHALTSCRVFLPVYSPSFFRRRYCGQEWSVFQERVEAHARVHDIELPALIVPVLWVPDGLVVPEAVAGVQYERGDDPDSYRNYGMKGLLRMGSRTSPDYEEMLIAIASRVVQAGTACELAADQPSKPIAQYRSVFGADPAATSAAGPGASRPGACSGPTHVRIVLVAATEAEVADVTLREDCSAYGADAAAWRPYLPLVADRAATIAQDVAAGQDMTSSIVIVDDTLAAQLAEADKANELTVVLVDPWSARLPQYNERMRQDVDGRGAISLAVLVAWHDEDPETQAQEAVLAAIIAQAFGNLSVRSESRVFRSRVGHKSFRRDLRQALREIQTRVVHRAAAQRKIDNGGLIVRRPTIDGPSGEPS